MTAVRAAEYCGWDALWLERGPLALVLVPQVGGRLMGIRWHGHELAFIDPRLAGRVDDVAAITDLGAAKRRLGFLLWGGDKTWLAPQDRWTDEVPFIDLESGAYEAVVGDAGVTMTSPVCRETGIQVARSVALGEGAGTWSVTHTLTNRSRARVSWAPWDVAMLRRPADVWLPTRRGSAHPDGVKTFDHEGESTTIRGSVVRRDGDLAVVSCREARKFKYGVDADRGVALAVMDVEGLGRVGLRKEVPADPSRAYAHGCVAEVFNASEHPYFEVELHGPLVDLAPGDRVALREQAALIPFADPTDDPAVLRRAVFV